ncbi:MAG TPA: hypothetical protein VFU22_29880 [Roseiflexaceae bacterium]|nr:hypothetical protein [Roseiflexaceae bacterium]
MTSRSRRYRSYLVRLWGSESDDAPVWHASAEDTLTGERKNFSGLAQLFQFLEQQTGETQSCESPPSAPQ